MYMNSKVHIKAKAIALRKKGYSYNDIIERLPVAKSTLSNWLKDLPLSQEEKKTLKKQRQANTDRGRIKAAAAHRRNRLNREKVLYQKAREEFNKYIQDPFFQVGLSLYWAEGSKRNNFFAFSNSDPDMIDIMLLWIKRFLGFNRSEVYLRLYIHKPYANENCEKLWADKLNLPLINFRNTIFKPTSHLVKKRPNYAGCLRVSLPRSKNHLQKMIFWQKMLVDYYRN